MNVYYNVEIRMKSPNVVNDDLIYMVAEALGASVKDVDEYEAYRAVIFFKSETKPEQMFIRIRDILFNMTNTIHYIDTIYRWEAEMNSDRYVCWSDGKEQHYTGRTIYEEDK